jgi:ribonuclease HI
MRASPAEILEAIRSLAPAQRRQLYRRLRAIGLLDVNGPWADTNRLQVAPAVRKPAPSLPEKPAASPTVSPPADGAGAQNNGEDRESVTPRSRIDAADTSSEPEEYQSGVRSKVVLGAPEHGKRESLEMMEPVPGQAPEAPIRIIFDGGSKGNPGKGYGSYALDWPGLPQQVVQLRFGDGVTNNEAEYDTLISALEATIKKLEDSGAGPEAAQLEIFGDSQLVVNQVLGEWEAKNARMRTRRDRVKYLLSQFGAWRLQHHDRENSVRVLGH